MDANPRCYVRPFSRANGAKAYHCSGLRHPSSYMLSQLTKCKPSSAKGMDFARLQFFPLDPAAAGLGLELPVASEVAWAILHRSTVGLSVHPSRLGQDHARELLCETCRVYRVFRVDVDRVVICYLLNR